MSAALKLSDLVPASSGSLDGCHRDNHDSRPQPVGVDISEIELQQAIHVGPDVRAGWDTSSGCEANHLQERCVDMAVELFSLKNKFDEQTKELKSVKRDGEAKERDFKELRRVCEEERRSSRSFMRRLNALEEEKTKLVEKNADLRVDKDRLLGVVRRHKEAGRSESIAAHRERLRRRHMSEKEVNKCDLAAAKLEVKTLRRENARLSADAKRQAGRVQSLEDDTMMLARKVAGLEQELETMREQKGALRREFDHAKAAERRAVSVSEREAALRLEAAERASAAESATEHSREDAKKAMLESESLRKQLGAAVEQLASKDSARSRHQGSVARYQTMVDAQAMALQDARQQLLSEKIKRQELERQARIRRIAAIDHKVRAAADAEESSERRAEGDREREGFQSKRRESRGKGRG